ncbi:hypothetical protein JXK06_00255 [Patescibacteria group bacterium]|nr:hypothetical protein [Patescibacteria group bacterium]
MFSTSGDILNLVLAVCIIALTIFLCLALFYFISSIRKTHRVIKMVEGGVAKAEEVINIARDKIKSGGAYLMILSELAKRAMDYFSEKQSEKRSEAKGKKKK